MEENIRFPTEFKFWKLEIERLGRQYGLSFYPIIYTLVTLEEMAEIEACWGYPTMPHHWRLGQESIITKRKARHGFGGVAYELVLLSDPIYGYLLETNPLVIQKLVMAHAGCGHGHLFKNNAYNRATSTAMLNVFGNDALRYDEHCKLHGEERVKRFFDQILSLEWLIDNDALFMRRKPKSLTPEEQQKKLEERQQIKRIEPREELPFYMDEFLNPPEWIEEQRKKAEKEWEEKTKVERGMKIPSSPEKDVLVFLMKYAPLESWQRDVIGIARRFSMHVASFGRTKFMHEGWASVWHRRILDEPGMTDQGCELTVFAEINAGVQHKSAMNPYKFAFDLWHDVEYRWNTGRHGQIWEECIIQEIRNDWDHFIVFKNLLEECKDSLLFEEKWEEFLAFEKALREGELGYPKEFFIRNFFTTKILIPAWVDYQHAKQRLAHFVGMRARMEVIEKDLDTFIANLREQYAKREEQYFDLELSFEARRDLYYGKPEWDTLYFWTIPEVKRQITYYQRLLAFRARFEEGNAKGSFFFVPESWTEWAKRFSGKIELGVGIKKMFGVAEYYDDWAFMQEFFTKDFCEEHQYFLRKQKTAWDWQTYPQGKQHWVFETRTFERIRAWMLFRFTNFNQPVIVVEDANFNNNRELYLKHLHNGVDLDWWSKDGMYVKDVLERLFHIWGEGKAVHIETIKTKKREDKPWWFSWHQTEEKDADELEELEGKRVIFSWGPREVEKATYLGKYKEVAVGFYETEKETVKYKAPF